MTQNPFTDIKTAERFTRDRLGIKRLTTAQKAEIALAVARHDSRQFEPVTTTTPYDRIDAIRRNLAVRIAKHFHEHHAPLFRSSRGGIDYGHGGHEHVDYQAYSKSYAHPARWRNAGARFDGSVLVIEDYLGKERQRIRIPFAAYAAVRDHRLDINACLSDDLYAINATPKTAVRYAVRDNGRVAKSGMAMLFDNPRGCRTKYWEHGATLTDCRAENDRKVVLVRRHEAEIAARADDERKRRRRDETITKIAKRLAARGRLVVSFEDARATGACRPGIESFCRANGLPTDVVDGARLLPLIGRDARVALAMRQAAQRQMGIPA